MLYGGVPAAAKNERQLTSNTWQAFLAHAARARAKPSFDLEEREPRLAIAKLLQNALAELASNRETFVAALDAALTRARTAERIYKLVLLPHIEWLGRWARSGDDSLNRALLAFLKQAETPESRFAGFAEPATQRQGSVGAPGTAILSIGSLFNFSVEPDALPVVSPVFFRWLRSIRDEEQAPPPESAEGGRVRRGPVEKYMDALALARDVQAEMVGAGIPIRDMLDAQSLIFSAALEREYFSPKAVADRREHGSAAGRTRRDGATPYLSICSCLGPATPEELTEWIEFHRLVGVERFFLYDNLPTAERKELLAGHVEQGLVVMHDWPVFPPIVSAFNDCLEVHRRDSRWIAFIDTDEFLFSPTGRPLPELLEEFEQWPGLGVNSVAFTSAGHKRKPRGLVVANYLHRASDHAPNSALKSLVDPLRTIRCLGPHHFEYRAGLAVDENHYPVLGPWTKSASFSRIRINHYRVKSDEDFEQKLETFDPSTGKPRPKSSKAHWLDAHPTELDDAILIYRADLERALAR